MHQVQQAAGPGSKCAYGDTHVLFTSITYPALDLEQYDRAIDILHSQEIDGSYVETLRSEYGQRVVAVVLDKETTYRFLARAELLKRHLKAAFPELQAIWGIQNNLGRRRLTRL